MLTRKDFEIVQKNTGFNIDLLEKVYHLTRIIHEIQQRPILEKNLILKGGTALNFLYLDIQRLSIDLDFDYTGKITKAEMIKQRSQLEQEIQNLASDNNYTLKEKGSSYIISRQNLQYQTIRHTKDHIKIEINYLNRFPLGGKEIKQFPLLFPEIPRIQLPTYTIEELIAQKSLACVLRSEPRDIYDLSMLSKQKIALEKIQTFVTIYFCIYANDNIINISNIKNLDSMKLQQELQQFIRNSETLDPESLREKTVIFLDKIFTFNNQQQRFIDTFFNEQRILPDLINLQDVPLKQHPALLHNLEKIKKH